MLSRRHHAFKLLSFTCVVSQNTNLVAFRFQWAATKKPSDETLFCLLWHLKGYFLKIVIWFCVVNSQFWHITKLINRREYSFPPQFVGSPFSMSRGGQGSTASSQPRGGQGSTPSSQPSSTTQASTTGGSSSTTSSSSGSTPRSFFPSFMVRTATPGSQPGTANQSAQVLAQTFFAVISNFCTLQTYRGLLLTVQ